MEILPDREQVLAAEDEISVWMWKPESPKTAQTGLKANIYGLILALHHVIESELFDLGELRSTSWATLGSMKSSLQVSGWN